MAAYTIVDNDNIVTVTLDSKAIANFPKLETSLSTSGDNLVMHYDGKRVFIPYDECSDPSEASADALRIAVLAILNNVTTGGGGGSTVTKLAVASGSFSGNTYTNAALIGKSLMVYSGGTLLDAGTDYTFNSGTGAITMAAPQDIVIQYW